jgi:hypothetical protein
MIEFAKRLLQIKFRLLQFKYVDYVVIDFAEIEVGG